MTLNPAETQEKLTPEKLKSNLDGFYGDLKRWRHWLGKLLFTPGVKYLIENAGNGAFWLLDILGSYQAHKKITGNEDLRAMQFWTLTVDLQKKTAVIVCTDGNDGPPAIKQEIEYTDFPLEEMKLYVCDNGDGTRTVMLPSEY